MSTTQPVSTPFKFWQWLTRVPSFADEELTARARLLNVILLATLVLFISILVLGPLVTVGRPDVPLLGAGGVAVSVGLLYLFRQGRIRLVSGLEVGLLAAAYLTALYNAGSIRQPGFSFFTILVMVTGLLFGRRAGFIMAGLSGLAGLGFMYAEGQGLLPKVALAPLTAMWAFGTVNAFFVATMLYLALRNLSDALGRMRTSNRELQAIQGSLQERVTTATRELAASAEQNRYLAAQLQTSAEVAAAAAGQLDLAALLPLVSRLIGERFNLYHVGIYLLEEQVGVRSASYTEGGEGAAGIERVVAGEKGIVASVLNRQGVRIAPDVSKEPLFRDDPDLPLTRSEMAVPLQTGKQLIGALDLQSARPGAFSEADVTVLTVLASQIAIAIQNARSFEQEERLVQENRRSSERQAALAEENRQLLERTQQALDQVNALNRRLTREGWGEYVATHGKQVMVEDAAVGFKKGSPADSVLRQAATTGELAETHVNGSTALAAPIVLRGEVIGSLSLQDVEAGEWTDEEVALLEGTAERVALALENARLFEQTQAALEATRQAAERDARLAAINDRLHASTDVKTILQTAAEELLRATGRSRTVVRLNPTQVAGELSPRPTGLPTVAEK
ncbi:MAG: GAF domain-containing protein [Anaerolineae bacterium]